MPTPGPPPRSRLARIYHRISFALGLGVTIWVVLGYIATRMRQARIKLVTDRQRADRVKQHFTSTMSNITFTVYALIPTLSLQVIEKLDVESLTEQLQHLAGKPKDVAPSLPTSSSEMTSQASSTTLESDFQRDHEHDPLEAHGNTTESTAARGFSVDDPRGIGSSWASEFVASSSSSSSARPGPSTDVSVSGEETYSAEHDLQDRARAAGDRGMSFDTPASHNEQLHSDLDVDTATDMSTSMSNITEPSPGSTSPDRDPDRARGTGGEEQEEGRAFGGPRSPESRYLRSPSTSPRRSRRSLPVREREDRTYQHPSVHPPVGAEEGQGFSYADVLRSGNVADEDKRDGPSVVKPGKTKAQLWSEIKVQSITRTILTFYLVPLLTIQTTSQLTLLARLHHLRNLSDTGTSSPSDDEDRDEPVRKAPMRSRVGKAAGDVAGLLTPWKYFSLESMGLDEYTSSGSGETEPVHPGGIVSGLWSLGSSTASYLLGTPGSAGSTAARPSSAATVAPLHSRLDVETERNFLCFSWWLLHIGWRELEETVRRAVVEVFKPVGLKKELAVADWLQLLDDVKLKVDGAIGAGFHDLLCPPADPAEFERLLIKHGLQRSCPIPMPPYTSPLAELLDQTSSHASSADFTYLLASCYDRMKRSCLDQFATQVYDEIVLLDPSDHGLELYDTAHAESLKSKRLVECLPFLTTWSRAVWARVPDEAVERTLGLSEVEGFATLIYADFASSV